MNTMQLLTATQAAAEKSEGITVNGPLIVKEFELFGMTFALTESVTVQWLIMAVLIIVFFILGRNLKVVPEGKRQAIAEMLVGTFTGLVKDSMGDKYRRYTPYVGALFSFVILSNLIGLFGFKTPTSDVSVVLSWGIVTFILVQRNRFKTGGIKKGLLSLTEPIFIMTPNNIIGEISSPVSQSFRMFGNMLAGLIISAIVYWGCTAIIGIPVVVPALLSMYFDIFAGVVQAFVFVTLTMIYVVMADCGPETE